MGALHTQQEKFWESKYRWHLQLQKLHQLDANILMNLVDVMFTLLQMVRLVEAVTLLKQLHVVRTQ